MIKARRDTYGNEAFLTELVYRLELDREIKSYLHTFFTVYKMAKIRAPLAALR